MDFKRIDTTSNRLKKALIKSNKKAIDYEQSVNILNLVSKKLGCQ